jgi:hypothetical protein
MGRHEMALARVVSFEGVSTERIEELKREWAGGGERPEGMPARCRRTTLQAGVLRFRSTTSHTE